MYSLGCVFLDIMTVLKKESLNTRRDYFNNHGSKKEYIRSNQDALHSWLKVLNSRLSETLENDDIPAEWIKALVQDNPGNRPSAADILNQIREAEGGFCGVCCLDDDEEVESSYQGSVLSTDTQEEDTEGTGLTHDRV